MTPRGLEHDISPATVRIRYNISPDSGHGSDYEDFEDHNGLHFMYLPCGSRYRRANAAPVTLCERASIQIFTLPPRRVAFVMT